MGIILGKARKLALASFNIRFILFPVTMLGDSLFLRASLLFPLPLFFRLLLRALDVDRCREKKSARSNFLRDCYYERNGNLIFDSIYFFSTSLDSIFKYAHDEA